MRRTKEEAAVTRATLLKAALAVFSSKGYDATTLDDIASAAKVTRGAIYWHFKSKADLYNTLIGPAGLVLGKLLTSTTFVIILIVLAFPMACVLYLLGGFSFSEFCFNLKEMLLTTVLYAVIGLWCSMLCRRTVMAVILSFALVIGFSFAINMVTGVVQGYEKRLKIEGVGYQARLVKKAVELTVGYANAIVKEPPEGVTVEVDNVVRLTARGGFGFGNTLLYAKGGATWLDGEVTINGDSTSASDWGWVAGAGVEQRFTPTITGGVEALFHRVTDFEGFDVDVVRFSNATGADIELEPALAVLCVDGEGLPVEEAQVHAWETSWTEDRGRARGPRHIYRSGARRWRRDR